MMADRYSAAFDFARFNAGAVSGANGAVFSGGGLSGNIGFASGMYQHGNVSFASADGVAILAFADAVETLLTGAGKSVSFSGANGLYTISATGAFVITWSGALGTYMRDILGFEGAATGSATSHTSTVRPDYYLISRVAGQSQVHERYKPSGRISYAEADDGSAYSTRPATVATYRDWVQPFETAIGPTNAEWSASKSVGGAPVRRTDATTTSVSWSWEDFYEHCAAELPFSLLSSGSEAGALYKMRGEAANFDPARITPDFDGHWSMPLKCRYLGTTVEV